MILRVAMELLSITIIFVAFLQFATASCALKEGFLDVISQTGFRDEIVLQALTNNTSLSTLIAFHPRTVEITLNDTTSISDVDSNLNNELKGKTCLKDVNKCMERDFEYEIPLEHFTRYLFAKSPPFDLTTVEGVSDSCRQQSLRYVQGLKQFKLWALRMYDSSAKLPTGILNGNINHLGDFDLCVGARSDDDFGVEGSYCLAALQVQIPTTSYLSGLHKLIHSHYHFKSQLDDPGHRVPKYSSINWALCVPHLCNSEDVQRGFRHVVAEIFNGTGLQYQAEVKPEMCQTLHNKQIPFSTFLVGGLFMAVFIWAMISTIYDAYTADEKNHILVSFSLRKNWSKLCSMQRQSDDLTAVHGVRFLNAFMLLWAHKSMAMFFIPYSNRTRMTEQMGQPWTVIGRAASLYTDPFIMISGTLTAYSLFGKLQRGQKIHFGTELTSRLFRIVPTLGALILFCTFVLPFISSGPQWNAVVAHHADNCKKYWWRNLLFIHNYFGFEDMCLTHTHHTGIDTQLFVVAHLFIPIIWRWPKRGLSAIFSLAVLSTCMRYYVTYTKQLSNYIHFGTSIQQLFSTADNMYSLPAHRVTVYIIGIFLGNILRNYKSLAISKFNLAIGNTLALLSFCVSVFGPSFMGSIDYVYNPRDAAWYAAFVPILWCLPFAWIILITHSGYKGKVGNFLSWPGFLITTRISYAVYLTQFPVYFYNVGTTRTSEYFEFFSKLFNLSEALWVIFLSILLTLLVEMPFQNIRNALTRRTKNAKIS